MRKLVFAFLLTFMSVSAQSQTIEWTKVYGGSLADVSNAITSDFSGNSYTTGYFQNTVDFDPGPGVFYIASGGYFDAYIQKLDANGNLVWAKSLGGPSAQAGEGIAVDDSENVYVTGYYSGTIDLDPGPVVQNVTSIGSVDAFIVKLDSSGNFVWGKTLQGPYNDIGHGIQLDQSGNIYVTGEFGGTVDFDPGPGVYSLTNGPLAGSTTNFFILKLDNNGNFVWARSGGSDTNSDEGFGVFTDANRNVYVSGTFCDTADLNPDAGVDIHYSSVFPGFSAFVIKLDSVGNFQWARSTTGSSSAASSVVVDHSGDVYFGGYYNSPIDLDPGPGLDSIPNSGGFDLFVIKLDASGNYLWGEALGTSGAEEVYQLYLDLYDNLYVTGRFGGTLDFDPTIGTHFLTAVTGVDNAFVQKLDPVGNFIWAQKIQGSTYTRGHSIHVGLDGSVFATGEFSSLTDFDFGPGVENYFPVGSSDIYTTKWSQGACDNLAVSFDGVSDVGCFTNGHAWGHGANGVAPYTYSWNTTPVTSDSSAFFDASGMYALTITDSIGCSHTSTIWVNGPSSQTTFDLNGNFTSTNAVVGRNFQIWLDVDNLGCLPITGTAKLVIDSATSYFSAVPAPDSMSTDHDTLYWNHNFPSYPSGHFNSHVILYISGAAHPLDTLRFKLIVSPLAGDIDTTNNIKYYKPIVNASYDPNSISVNPLGSCAEGFVSATQTLSYSVEFQNTGTADAANIYVLDTLDSDLDINSLRIISSSHPMYTEILPGNVLKFHFDNINLPDSTTSEPNSHGHFVFEIKPNLSAPLGATIYNTVGIYFDFNSPVYTNTVLNTISNGQVNTSTTTTGSSISANFSGGTYQWLDCSGNTAIIGETGQNYTPSSTGSYAVIVSDGCFSDTSACIPFLILGENTTMTGTHFAVYPNPAQTEFTIMCGSPVIIKITNLLGAVVLTKQVKNNEHIDISLFSKGVYFIQTPDGKTVKLTKY